MDELKKVQEQVDQFKSQIELVMNKSSTQYKVVVSGDDKTIFQILEDEKPMQLSDQAILAIETLFKITKGALNGQEQK